MRNVCCTLRDAINRTVLCLSTENLGAEKKKVGGSACAQTL